MRHALALFIAILIVLALSCSRTRKDPVAPIVSGPPSVAETISPGLTVRLRPAKGHDAAPDRVTPAVAEPLSAASVAGLLARLPPLASEETDKLEFARTADSPPAPRTAATVAEPFPPEGGAGAAPTPAAGPLEVLRITPSGDVPLAPNLAVTFNAPIVEVAAHADLAAKNPVELEPQPAGSWRFVGAKTVVFDPSVRFPMATDYRVTVPKGTRGATGGVLGKSVTATFATPPPTLVDRYPEGVSTRRDPIVYLRFDQAVEPRAVLSHVRLRPKRGREDYPVRLATRTEVAADADVTKRMAAFEGAESDRWVALRPVAPLPPNTEISVAVGPGLPSAEGPKTTTKPESFAFRTFGAFAVTGHECGWNNKCPPGTPFEVVFSNRLELERFREAFITVDPPVPGMTVQVAGDRLYVSGRTKGRTTYRVELSADVTDVFGQTLGEPASLKFKVGKAYPSLDQSGGPLVVADPASVAAGKPVLTVNSVNYSRLRVQISAVTVDDWSAYLKFLSRAYDRGLARPPGREVFAGIVRVEGERDVPVETRLELAAAMKGGLGHAVVTVEALPALPTRDPNPRIVTWVQATRIGLSAFIDGEELVGWASGLSDGNPLAGLALELPPTESKATTDRNGLARLPLGRIGAHMLVARAGPDVAFVPQRLWDDSSADAGWRKSDHDVGLAWFVLDDRGTYKPGETVHIKGWVRRRGLGRRGDLGLPGASVNSIGYTLSDARGNELAKGRLKVRRLGSFDAEIAIPKETNLGSASLMLTATGWRQQGVGWQHWHGIQIQEFRRPEYEVGIEVSQAPHFVGTTAALTVSADYYTGGGLPAADVAWQVTSSETQFTPPNRSDYTFGRFIPWWIGGWRPGPPTPQRVETYAAQTDAMGKHRLEAEFVSVDPPLPSSVRVEAAVTDVNRQTWAGTTSMLVHPANVYVGLRTERRFVEAGEPIELAGVVVDLEGKAANGRPLTVEIARMASKQQPTGELEEVAVDPKLERLTSQGNGFSVALPTTQGGVYRVRARVSDESDRPNLTELRIYVAGEDSPPDRSVDQQQVTLIPDRDEYGAGETAKILIVAPFADAHGILTVRRQGLQEVVPFAMTGRSQVIDVPLGATAIPGVTVQVDLAGSAPRRDEQGNLDSRAQPRPAFASGICNLEVPPHDRMLGVTVAPALSELEPGTTTTVDVALADANGTPFADADVAVTIVDEAILALLGRATPDPVAALYPQQVPGVEDAHSRAYTQLDGGDPQALGGVAGGEVGGVTPSSGRAFGAAVMDESTIATKSAPAPPMEAAPLAGVPGGIVGGVGARTPIALRSNFEALALFEASARSDANGKVSVAVNIPDSLTRYRVLVVAAGDADKFGAGEATITARLPLMVRPSAPRFLNFGDSFELPVVVQNQTDEAMTVELAARVANLELTAGQGRRFRVPARDRVEARLPAATSSAGRARVQVVATAGDRADAAMLDLPVWTPATTEAFASYGELDAAAVNQPILTPNKVFPQFGGLEVTTSSTAVSALTDAFVYLVDYPFECNEQIASRILAVAALRDVLHAFDAKGLPGPTALTAKVIDDLKRLERRQRSDGGFGFWSAGGEDWPFLAVHVAHAVARAKTKGFEVPRPLLERSKAYLAKIDKHIPRRYSAPARRLIRAYAAYVRNLLGDPDPAGATKLLGETKMAKTPLPVLGFLLPTLAASGDVAQVRAISEHLDNRVTQTASSAHFVTDHEDGDHVTLASDRRADGILLEALIATDSKADLIPKLVRGLLAHRTAGRWSNTQDTVFVLLALDAYFARYEHTRPDFVARVWLGEQFAGDQKYRGRTTDQHQITVPMTMLGEPGERQDLVIAKTGPGRLYYRVGMRYAPIDLNLPAVDHGFAVAREYEAIDDPGDVKRTADGSWRIRSGARVRVRVTMVAPSRRYHVALVDPLPAGFETLNPGLAVTEAIPADPQTRSGEGRGPGMPLSWWGPWYQHQNFRDERAEAFSTLVDGGAYEFVYVARATTPGEFVVPPAKAEEMYEPESFGRSGVDRVSIE